MTEVDDVLAHYGVKGMKWGVRRRSGGVSKASPDGSGGSSSSTDAPPASKGRRFGRSAKKKTPQEISEDAAAFRAIKAKAKEKGASSLTNEEMRIVTTRFDLEQKYSKAFPKKKNPAVKFIVDDVLIGTGKSLIKDIAKEQGKQLGIKKGLLPAKEDKKPKEKDD